MDGPEPQAGAPWVPFPLKRWAQTTADSKSIVADLRTVQEWAQV